MVLLAPIAIHAWTNGAMQIPQVWSSKPLAKGWLRLGNEHMWTHQIWNPWIGPPHGHSLKVHELCNFFNITYPNPGNSHIPPWEKENHLEKCLCMGYMLVPWRVFLYVSIIDIHENFVVPGQLTTAHGNPWDPETAESKPWWKHLQILVGWYKIPRFRSFRGWWLIIYYQSHEESMGMVRYVYLSTWMVDFYGKCK